MDEAAAARVRDPAGTTITTLSASLVCGGFRPDEKILAAVARNPADMEAGTATAR
jgi:hypothetical protein